MTGLEMDGVGRTNLSHKSSEKLLGFFVSINRTSDVTTTKLDVIVT